MTTHSAPGSQKKTGGVLVKTGIAFVVLIAIVLAVTFYKYYFGYFGSNVTDKREYLYVRTGSGFDDVLKSLTDSGILKDERTFVWAAQNMNYKKIHPGRYRITSGMGNRKLVNMLKAGNQEPVKLRFQGKRLKEDFAALIASRIEADSASLVQILDSEDSTAKYGFTPDNVYTMFIPNSYEVYWNTSASQFVTRMHAEYGKFWKGERLGKAAAIHLTPVQVSILASIVDAEALYDKEMPVIAGLYLNRLKSGQALESDPTVIFATKDFTIRRVLLKHLRTPSPYNTYLHTGLPPGPVMMPSINAIEAVLNYDHNNYLYMCAKEDFSGYHNFAATRAEHEKNAQKYRHALDLKNIKN